ncbi:Inactive dipeptidyl peptidase 10 [Chamberlinius hualienensis]
MSASSKIGHRHDSVEDDLAVKFLRELVASSPSQRNWRGIGIALLVIVAVCSLIFTAVVLLTPADTGPRVKGERFTLDDLIGNNFTTPNYEPTWISSTELLYKSIDDRLILYNAESGNESVFVSDIPFRSTTAQYWLLSPDRRYLLLARKVQQRFKYSFNAYYYIYNISQKKLQPLTHDLVANDEFKYSYATWGSVGNALVFVYENNIYYKESADGNVRRLTSSKRDEAVFVAVPDWLYEVEIFKSNRALWFSKDGRYLCYATFNDSLVPDQFYETFFIDDLNKIVAYPQKNHIKYPKANQINPAVVLQVVDLTSRSKIFTSVDVKPPLAIKDQEHYVTAVGWASNTNLSVIWMNRRQNLSIISICSPPLWICNESFREDMKQLGWVDWYDPPLFSDDTKKYFVRAAINDGNAGLFRQIVVNGVYDKSTKTVTLGKFEVTKIVTYDNGNDLIYYIAAPEGRPGERHLYRISPLANMANSSGYCLTCDLAPDCLYVDAKFSPLASYYVLECQGPSVPSLHVINSTSNKRLKSLNESNTVQERLLLKALPQEKTFRVHINDDYDANVRLYLPPEFQEDEITQYPLVISVDGSPGSQTVDQKFRIDFGTFLSSNKSFIYGLIDGRGSGFQGEKRKFELYRRLGSVEVQDQIAVTMYLLKNLPFIDKRKVAMWGWSYGGYVTAKVIGTETDIIKCGIAVAPIKKWDYYNSVYAERYMGLPNNSDNYHGYTEAEVVPLAKNFKQKEFYIIHGTADDQVHFQQSMLLSSALVHQNIIFRSQVYPDEKHALNGVQKHLYLSMTSFLEDCFHLDLVDEKFLQEPTEKDDQGE